MKNNKIITSFFALLMLFLGTTILKAATTPSFGIVGSYGVLSSTYTNTTASTINGNIGYTTGPAVSPTVSGDTHVADSIYTQAGADQDSILTNLNSQICTFTFASGAVDLFTDTTHGSIGVYMPGVYCVLGAMNVGGAITLSGSGTYIFRSTGALTTTTGSSVSLLNTTDCDVFWTPTEATTIAANTTFSGTVIDPSGITVGANTVWVGRSLAFGGTVTTDTTTINALACATPTSTLKIIKEVINNNSGTASASSFNIHLKLLGIDVLDSPSAGIVAPGKSYILSAGTYVVSEDNNPLYTRTFSGDCDSDGSVVIISNSNKICTITSTDIPVSSGGGRGGVYPMPSINQNATPIFQSIIPLQNIQTPIQELITIPGLPNTGFPPKNKLNTFTTTATIVGSYILFIIIFKNRKYIY